MMGPVLAACLLIILSTAWISQANEALCKKDGGVCSCNNNKNSVDCSGKMLTAIPSNIPPDTTQLRLHQNSLSKLSPTAFHNLKELTYLDLDGNKLQTLPAGVFNHLVELDRLDLNYNQLQSLPDGVFEKLTQLKELYLQYNDLKSLPEGVFDKLTKLTRLDLDYNQLKYLPSGVFDKLTLLEKLYLENNQLRSVPKGAFDSLSSLSLVTLDTNPWDCSCRDILYLRNWIREKQGNVSNIEAAECAVGNKAVLDITEKDAASDCVSPNTTTAIPTSTTTPASVIYDDIHEIKVPQENFQKFLGYQEPDHLPTQPQCLMSISGYLGLMMSLMLTSAAILYVFHFLKKA
uniref:Variable lymphocyte receptor A n=1 Tax=Eptatretus burgeri TaxID=7764 RepID=Q32QY6_EPTBU|nr:variable lymphocyte receptor A [Eptatretus burgeri]